MPKRNPLADSIFAANNGLLMPVETPVELDSDVEEIRQMLMSFDPQPIKEAMQALKADLAKVPAIDMNVEFNRRRK